jgi:hypothetical protein
MYRDRVIGGMGDFADYLPAWAAAILRGAEGMVPALGTLDVAGQIAVAAMMDLSPQWDRILAAKNQLNSEWSLANEATANIGGIPQSMADAFIARMNALDRALDQNETATSIIQGIINSAVTAGAVIPGLAGSEGMGEPITLTVIACVAILTIGGAIGYTVVRWHSDALDSMNAAEAVRLQMHANDVAQQQGQPIPYPHPATAAVRPDPASSAITGVMTLGAVAVGGWLLLQFLSKKGAG